MAKSTQASASLTLNAIQKLIIASGLVLQHHQRPSIKIVNESKKSHGESKSPKSTAAAQIRKILQEIDHINARGGFYSPSQLHEQMNICFDLKASASSPIKSVTIKNRAWLSIVRQIDKENISPLQKVMLEPTLSQTWIENHYELLISVVSQHNKNG